MKQNLQVELPVKNEEIPKNMDFHVASQECSGDKLSMTDEYVKWGLYYDKRYLKHRKKDSKVK